MPDRVSVAGVRALLLPDAAPAGRRVVGLVSASHFVFHTYMMLLPAALTAIVATSDLTATQVGLAIGVQGAFVTGLQLPYGYVSDAYSREAVLLGALALSAVGVFLVAAAPSYGWLLVAEGVLGAGIAGHHPAHYPMLSAATRPVERGRAFSLHGFTGALGFATPPAVVSAAIALGGTWRDAAVALGVVGVAFAAFAAWVLRTRVSADVRAGDADAAVTGTVRERLAGLFKPLFAGPAIPLLTLLALTSSTATWAIMTYTAVLLTGTYGLAAGTANLLVSAMIAVGAVAVLVGGLLSDSVSATVVLLGGYAALVVVSGAVGSGLFPLLAVVGLVLVLNGTVTITRPARSKLVDALSERADVGKNFALITIGISGGSVLGPPAFGSLVDSVGAGRVFLVVAGLGVLAGALTLVVVRASGGLQTPTPAEAGGH